MNNKDKFKNFAKLHPELITYVENDKMTWQKFYEIYDIYGEDLTAWQEFIKPQNNVDKSMPNIISDRLKNMDMNSIEEHIKTAQKALALVSELTTKNANPSSITPKVPRPINKFFED